MNDQEVLEAQIIENLEREDVHPLREAETFKLMIDKGNYDIEDIATKIGKSEKFILQRLSLNMKTPNFIHNKKPEKLTSLV